MARLIYDPEAKIEIIEAALYYENCQEGLGKKFLNELEQFIEKILLTPTLYRTLRGRFRRCLLNKFPYGIIYAIGNDEIYIAAVMHLKRKPGYWIRRHYK